MPSRLAALSDSTPGTGRPSSRVRTCVNISARGGEPRREPLEGGKRGPVPLVAQPTIVSLTFDDGCSSQYTLRSMLARHGMHGTFYVNSGRVGLPGMMTWSQLSELAADGHEIGGHGVDHVKLTTLNRRDARRQVSDDRQALISRGFDVSSFAYPFGSHNASIRSIVRECGYSSARRAWGLCPIGQSPPDRGAWYPDVAEQIPPVDRYAMRTTAGLRAWSTLGDIQSLITRAEINGGGLVMLVFHRIGEGSGPHHGYSVSPSVLGRFLGWLGCRAGHGTHVLTVQDISEGGRSVLRSTAAGGLEGVA
jgi:Polysaccharide deacetylase